MCDATAIYLKRYKGGDGKCPTVQVSDSTRGLKTPPCLYVHCPVLPAHVEKKKMKNGKKLKWS